VPKPKQTAGSYDAAKPDVKPDSYGLSSKGEGRSPQIRHTRPEVAKHCARMILAHNMDTQAAVSKMLAATHPDATDAQITQLARTIQASPHVQREMTKLLEDIGYGDEALKKLIGLLWQEVLGGNDKRWAAAARLLAEITGAGKAAEKGKKLPTLRLGGMEEGLSKMLGDAAPTNDIEELPDETPLDILEEDEE
jgi:hypothetical protein